MWFGYSSFNLQFSVRDPKFYSDFTQTPLHLSKIRDKPWKCPWHQGRSLFRTWFLECLLFSQNLPHPHLPDCAFLHLPIMMIPSSQAPNSHPHPTREALLSLLGWHPFHILSFSQKTQTRIRHLLHGCHTSSVLLVSLSCLLLLFVCFCFSNKSLGLLHTTQVSQRSEHPKGITNHTKEKSKKEMSQHQQQSLVQQRVSRQAWVGSCLLLPQILQHHQPGTALSWVESCPPAKNLQVAGFSGVIWRSLPVAYNGYTQGVSHCRL